MDSGDRAAEEDFVLSGDAAIVCQSPQEDENVRNQQEELRRFTEGSALAFDRLLNRLADAIVEAVGPFPRHRALRLFAYAFGEVGCVSALELMPATSHIHVLTAFGPIRSITRPDAELSEYRKIASAYGDTAALPAPSRAAATHQAFAELAETCNTSPPIDARSPV